MALTANGARIIETRTGKVLEEHLLSKEAAKKAIAIGRKYDTLLEVYFDGQGYAQKDEIAQVRKYHKNPNMWDYFLRTRIAVDRLEDLLDEKEGGSRQSTDVVCRYGRERRGVERAGARRRL